jgi:sulfide:quinone oxidoreductase
MAARRITVLGAGFAGLSTIRACADALGRGTLVVRTPARNWLLPPTRLFHWAKHAFERRYLKQYQ